MRSVMTAAVALCAVACDGGDYGAPMLNPPLLPGEEVGRAISPAEMPSHDLWNPGMVWSPDGREVYYFPRLLSQGLNSGIRAADVESGTVRTVTTGLLNYQTLRVAGDGSLFFWAVFSHDSAGTIYRMREGASAPERLLTRAEHVFAISDDGTRLAHSWAGTVRVTRVDTGEELSTHATHGLLLALGPAEFAHGVWGAVLRTTPLGGGPARTVFDPRDPAYVGELGVVVADARWTEAGLDVLASGRSVFITSAASGTTRRLWGASQSPIMVRHATWSPDGRKVAAWVSPVCVSTVPCQSTLHLIDVGTGAAVRIGHTTERPNPPLFSPDGRRLALPHGRLHVMDLP